MTKDSLRIAIFTETFLPKIDGIVSILCLALRRLHELGHQAILFGPPGGPPEYEGAEIVGVGGPRVPFYPEMRANIPKRQTFEQLQRFQPDLVHAVHPFFLGPFGLHYAKKLRLPTVASFHTDLARYAQYYGLGFLTPLLWAYPRYLHNRAPLTLCTSTFMRDDLRARGFRRVRWWKRGIDTDHFTPGPVDQAMRARLSEGHPQDFLIVNVGRHAPEKGLKQLRQALFPQESVRLALVGDGPSHEQLKEHFAGTPTSFPGYLRGAELVAAYRSADAFIFPSTTETFGLVALEAMACALPVIAARAGGLVDSVTDGKTGFFFDPNQPGEIRALVERWRSNPALRAEMSANALEHARSRSWRATMDQLVDYYHLALRVHRRYSR